MQGSFLHAADTRQIMVKPEILYEDRDLVVVKKPAGTDSQESRGSGQDMVSILKNYRISTELSTQGGGKAAPPYIAVVHRLDRQVSGVMVYAKTKAAAAHLSKQVQDGRMEKTYLAAVCGKPVDRSGTFVDYLWKDGKNNVSRVVDKAHGDAKYAELSWEVLAEVGEDRLSGSDTGGAACANPPEGGTVSLVRIHLKTGRHHQIRVQFSSRGLPLWGDVKYNPAFSGKRSEGPALCAAELSFVHPKTGKRMKFSILPEHSAFRAFPMLQGQSGSGRGDC